MSARDSLFLFRYPVLRDPPCDIAFAPDATLGKLAHGLRKGLHLRDLVGAAVAVGLALFWQRQLDLHAQIEAEHNVRGSYW